VLSIRSAVQVSPRGRDQCPRTVGQDEHEQCLALEGMASTDDGHAFWVTVEVVMMGIVSSFPSAVSIMSCC